jgi:transposase
MEKLAKKIPQGDVYIIWDNLNIHCDGPSKRWTRFNERHGNRFHFVYTPLHASWVNQIEIWFSILQRRILRYGNFSSLVALKRGITGFIAHWNRYEAHPFRWTFRGRFQQHSPRRAA